MSAALVCVHSRLAWTDAVARNHADWRRVADGGPPRLRLFEPAAATLSLGRRAASSDDAATSATIDLARSRSVPVVDDDRGGLATLHLPGQIVALVALPMARLDVPAFVGRSLVRLATICVAAGVEDVEAIVDGPDVGLWRDGRKLASVGLRHSAGVVRHGFALNVAVATDAAAGLVLCGQPTSSLATIRPGGSPPWHGPIAADLASALLLAWRDGAHDQVGRR